MESQTLFGAFEHFNLFLWDDYTTWVNFYALLVFALLVAAAALAVAGITHRKK